MSSVFYFETSVNVFLRGSSPSPPLPEIERHGDYDAVFQVKLGYTLSLVCGISAYAQTRNWLIYFFFSPSNIFVCFFSGLHKDLFRKEKVKEQQHWMIKSEFSNISTCWKSGTMLTKWSGMGVATNHIRGLRKQEVGQRRNSASELDI